MCLINSINSIQLSILMLVWIKNLLTPLWTYDRGRMPVHANCARTDCPRCHLTGRSEATTGWRENWNWVWCDISWMDDSQSGMGTCEGMCVHRGYCTDKVMTCNDRENVGKKSGQPHGQSSGLLLSVKSWWDRLRLIFSILSDPCSDDVE